MPGRGEVWLVDLGLAAKGWSCGRGSRFEVAVPVRFLRPGGFDAQSLVTVPVVRLIRRLGRLTNAQLVEVEQGVRAWLGLPGPPQGAT